LRAIEREVLEDRREAQAASDATASAASVSVASEPVASGEPACGTTADFAVDQTEVVSPPAASEQATAADQAAEPADEAGQVVLDYCGAVRGILNDDQGGPLHPPGLRMAEALKEVRESLQRNLDAKKGGAVRKQLCKLAGCIDRGLQAVAAEQEQIKEYVCEVKRVEATLDPSKGSVKQRKKRFARLRRRLVKSGDEVRMKMAVVMVAFSAGLFAGPEVDQEIQDNLELERWFRLPKGHERRIHGRKHAGVRLVQEGATLMPTLDAHKDREEPFEGEELLDYKDARPPKQEQQAMHRRKVMRRARSKKQRPILLAELERRYRDAP
jgi:hypothetical protein